MCYFFIMKLIGIEWDEAKNILNKQEHYNGYYQIDGEGWGKAT